ncbi:MAG: acyl CoA--acetate/3-ketoacid CoA transferase subunit beta [Chloroflexi bacterium]|nr:acyl CoA--acetate/3-ketoacid CoA transferase subunit beta [Chloroflexota bacterium]
MTEAYLFTETEAVICHGAKMVEEDRSYWVVGGGPPRLTMHLAQRLYFPNVTIFTEDGCIAPRPILPPDPLGNFVNSKAGYRAVAWTNMNTVCCHASLGYVDYGFLSTLQVDPYGNINSSLLGGDYHHPGRRFGGAGGANEIASLCWRTILMTTLEKRKFVKKLDFITSPGFLDGSPEAREGAGLPQGTGPWRVITSEAVFGYDGKTHYMKLLAIAPWVTVEDVLAKMEFEPLIADVVETLPFPTEEELALLRVTIDPRGQVIGEGNWIQV